MRLTLLVVQFSDAGWTAAPHLAQAPGQTSRPDQSDSALPAKDDIVGWPDELLIDFPDFPDCTLDSAAARSSTCQLISCRMLLGRQSFGLAARLRDESSFAG
jgi:hypothetical protein